jgi:aminomethyltransferase
MKKTPLYNKIIEQKGKMVGYAGYEMPVRFDSIIKEHQTVRTKAGLFDVSHMVILEFSGKRAVYFLNYLLTNDLRKLSTGQMQYSLMCVCDGGTVDDLMVYKTGEDEFMLVLNAACMEQDKKHILANMQEGVVLNDVSDEKAILALQGPKASKIMKLAKAEEFCNLKPLSFAKGVIAKKEALVSRSGYTGEDGFEIYCKNEAAEAIYDHLMQVGAPLGLLPIGLGARDTLRLEAALPLYGNELDLFTSPIEARLKWAVCLDKPDFIGKSSLLQQVSQDPSKRLHAFIMEDKAIARHGYQVKNLQSEVTGFVASGAPSPTLGCNIGMAYLNAKVSPGSKIYIDIRGKLKEAKIVKRPFYKRLENTDRVITDKNRKEK